MFQLSKKVEYSLIALRHMASGRSKQLFTTKEISDRYNLSYELLAKVMQKLCKAGYIISHQGVNGGYVLNRDPRELKLSGIIHTIEGKPNVTVVRCESNHPEDCVLHSTCTIKIPMMKLQNNINKVLDELTVMEMF
jgi:Rrf2 family protein